MNGTVIMASPTTGLNVRVPAFDSLPAAQNNPNRTRSASFARQRPDATSGSRPSEPRVEIALEQLAAADWLTHIRDPDSTHRAQVKRVQHGSTPAGPSIDLAPRVAASGPVMTGVGREQMWADCLSGRGDYA